MLTLTLFLILITEIISQEVTTVKKHHAAAGDKSLTEISRLVFLWGKAVGRGVLVARLGSASSESLGLKDWVICGWAL